MGTRRKILVIDDDQSVCDFIARTLKSRGYDVFTEIEYQEGIKRAEEILPDLTFISLLLDTTNGLKVSRELHAIERLKKVPVIMLISYKGELDPKYTVSIGIVDVMVKPPTEKDLVLKTEAAIGSGNTLDVEDVPSGTPDMYASRIGSEGQEINVPGEDYLTEATLVAGEEEVSLEERLSVGPVVPAEGPSVDRKQTEEDDYYVPRLRPDDIEFTADEDLSDDVGLKDGLSPQRTEEDISVLKEDEEIPLKRAERQNRWNKMLLAAGVVGLVAVIGVGTYMGLNFFFAGKSRPAVPPEESKGHVRVAPEAQKRAVRPLPQTGGGQSSGKRETETIPPVSKLDRKKDEAAPRQSPIKEREKQPLQESRTEGKAAVKEEATEKKGTFSLQVGYFGDLKNAEALAAKMKEKGYKVALRKEEKEGKKLSYRVLVGEYKSRNEAMVQSVAILRKEGISSVPYKE